MHVRSWLYILPSQGQQRRRGVQLKLYVQLRQYNCRQVLLDNEILALVAKCYILSYCAQEW